MEKGEKVIMEQKIHYALSYLDENAKVLACEDVDREEYNAKYRGLIKCINGCKAKIKFTQRKNNVKFFSTWNKEGHLHEEGCPYHVDYKGKKGRDKLEAYYISTPLDDEYIEKSLKRKAEALMRQYDSDNIIHPDNGSMLVEETGIKTVAAYTGNEDDYEETDKRPYIGSQDAKYLTRDDVGRRIHVYGFAKHAFISEGEKGTGNKYGYINLDFGKTPVSMAMPQSFYSNEDINGINDFEIFMNKLIKYIENNENNPPLVIAYGEITARKKKDGLTVIVTAPRRILINSITVKRVIAQGI